MKVSNNDVGSQFPQFSSQIGLDEIVIDEIEGSPTKKKPRVAFAVEEDTHLISSWLNISTDPIVGVGQGKEAFWLRVTKNYNKFRGELHERAVNQLKSRWQKINLGVQRFKGHYNKQYH